MKSLSSAACRIPTPHKHSHHHQSEERCLITHLTGDRDWLAVWVVCRCHSRLFALMSTQLYGDHERVPHSRPSASIQSNSPRLLDVAQSKVSLALEQLNFDQELFVVQFLQLFQQLRSQSQSFVVSMRVIVQRHQTSLSSNHRGDHVSQMKR